jgi:hypothetical protein
LKTTAAVELAEVLRRWFANVRAGPIMSIQQPRDCIFGPIASIELPSGVAQGDHRIDRTDGRDRSGAPGARSPSRLRCAQVVSRSPSPQLARDEKGLRAARFCAAMRASCLCGLGESWLAAPRRHSAGSWPGPRRESRASQAWHRRLGSHSSPRGLHSGQILEMS